jgi:hypothetical protein
MESLSYNTPLRILLGIAMIPLIAWGYWWMIALAAITLLFIFPSYYEILLWGVCLDALYGHHFAFITALILFTMMFLLKKRLVFYA